MRHCEFVAGCFAIATAVGAASAGAVDSQPALAPPILVDRWGVEHDWSVELNDLAEGKPRAFAIVFLDTNCPIVTRLAPSLVALSTEFRPLGVQTIGIYSNDGVTRMAMAAHRQRLDLPFPVFLDVGGRLARRLGARATPEAFLLDAELHVRYRGAIDDAGWKKTALSAKQEYLREAIEGLLAGRADRPPVRAQGCELQLPPEIRPLPERRLTYYDDVAPIVRRRCVECHHAGGIGPFALETFESLRDEAATVRREVEYQRMPPWHAVEGSGAPLEGVQALADDERRTIVDWISQGFARRRAGEADWLVAGTRPNEVAPPKRSQPGFAIGGGRPDFVADMPRPFHVPASETIDYQYFWVPNDFAADRYIQEVEVLPGERRVVHHMQVFLVEKKLRPKDVSQPLSGAWMMITLNGVGGAQARRIASYTPGDQLSARRFASDAAMLFPAGYDVVFEVHYTPIDEPADDRSSVGFVWRTDPTPPRKVIADQLFIRPRNFEIGPHEPQVRSEFEPYFKQSVVLLDIRPHMHLRGGDARVAAVFPDGREQTLVTVPAFDFNWQRRYLFREPVRLPAGSSLRFIAHWDNTRLNPNNPEPGGRVFFGEASEDEMSNLGVTYYVDEEAEAVARRKVASPVAK